MNQLPGTDVSEQLVSEEQARTRMPSPLEDDKAEIAAMSQLSKTLHKLTEEQRNRVLFWLHSKYPLNLFKPGQWAAECKPICKATPLGA